MRSYRNKILLSITIIISLIILGVDNKVYGEEILDNIKDFNYIPIVDYEFVENDGGYYDIDDNGNKYYYYNIIQNEGDILEIIYKDGTTHKYEYKGGMDDRYDYYVDSDGKRLWYKGADEKATRLNFSYPDQWVEHLNVGTYYATIEAFGIKKKVPITIAETPVKSIKYIPISNKRYTSEAKRCYLKLYGVYFTFGSVEGDKLKVEYKDGTKKIYTYQYKNFKDFYDENGNLIESPITIDDAQFYNKPWKINKNNTLTVNYLGVEYNISYKLIEDEHRFETIIDKSGNIIKKCMFCGYIKSKFPSTVKLSSKSFKYNGKVQKPNVIIKDGKGKTINKSNYTITYSNINSNKVGEYKVTVKFKNKYKGKKVLTYTIKPTGVKINKLTSSKKEINIKWNKNINQTTGYEIEYSTNEFFETNSKIVTINNKITSKTLKKLKSNKKYYIRIRTYKTVNNKKYYSSWSKVSNIKTKH